MDESEGAIAKVAEEEAETNTMASEQVELEIAQILEKINRFTQLVCFSSFEPHTTISAG